MLDSERKKERLPQYYWQVVCQALCFVGAFGWTLVFFFFIVQHIYTNIKYFALTFIDHRINYTNMPVIITIWNGATERIIAGQINTHTHTLKHYQTGSVVNKTKIQ